MKAYIIVFVQVTNPIAYDEYKSIASKTVELYQGKYLARGGDSLLLEGGWLPSRSVILEFPNKQLAQDWWSSAEYAPGKKIRQENAITNMILVEGVA